MIYALMLDLTCYTDFDDLDPEDQDNPFLTNGFTQLFFVHSGSREMAEDLVLDWFHAETAIACLDDFSIDVVDAPVSAHDMLEQLTNDGLNPENPMLIMDAVLKE